MIRALSLSAVILLAACATEWRTSEPVTPLTYEAPAYRAASSVGRLSRLAVMKVALHLEDDGSEDLQPARIEQRDRLARVVQENIVEYLEKMKGYRAIGFDAPAPALDADAMREAGARLKVDGIVVVEQWLAQPMSTMKALTNVFLMNYWLFRSLFATSLRVTIYEAATGRMVWRRALTGEALESAPTAGIHRAFGELENAVPAQLRR